MTGRLLNSLIIVLTILSLGAIVLWRVLPVKTEITKEDVLFEEIEKIQAVGKDKYTQIMQTRSPDGMNYEVHEYVGPKGAGWQLLIYTDKGKLLESRGYGPESDSRTFSVPQPIPSVTSTL